MQEDVDITPESLPEDADVTSPGEEGAVTETDSQVLEKINKTLGKDFKDLDTALKSVKDTYSHVGKRKEDLVKEIMSEGGDFVPKEVYEKDRFFDRNPQYANMRDVMEALAVTRGISVDKVVELDNFQEIFNQVSGYQQAQQKQSVLSSNPVLQKTSDSLKQAREAASVGNIEAASDSAAKAVIDAFGLE